MKSPWLNNLIALAIILGVGPLAQAESLQPIHIATPVDGHDADTKCNLAFQQITKDLLEKEARENFFCMAKLDQKFLDGIEAEFKILCGNSMAYGEPVNGSVTVETQTLKTSLFQAYKPYSSQCVSQALAESNASGGFQQSSNDASGGSAMNEAGRVEYKPGCFVGSGCL